MKHTSLATQNSNRLISLSNQFLKREFLLFLLRSSQPFFKTKIKTPVPRNTKQQIKLVTKAYNYFIRKFYITWLSVRRISRSVTIKSLKATVKVCNA